MFIRVKISAGVECFSKLRRLVFPKKKTIIVTRTIIKVVEIGQVKVLQRLIKPNPHRVISAFFSFMLEP